MKHRFLKRVTAILTGLYFGATMLLPFSATAENEENNTLDTAEIISVNTTIDGALSDNSDADYFQFTTEENGAFCVTFSHEVLEASYAVWRLTLLDHDGETIRTWDVDGDADVIATDMMGMRAGTYCLKISSVFYQDAPYAFQVDFTAASASEQLYEAEYNNTAVSANPLPVNTSCMGNLYSSDDVDYYAVTLSENGSIALTFAHPALTSDAATWCMELLDADLNKLTSWDISGLDCELTTDHMGCGAGTYYIRITSVFYNGSSYSLLADYTSAALSEELYETEYNNTLAQASTLPCNTECNGNLYSSEDVDCYAVKLTESGAISISFQHPELSSESTAWRVELLDESGNVFTSWDVGGKQTSLITDCMGFGAGMYYVRVSSVFIDNASYTVSVNFVASQENGQLYETEMNNTMDTAEPLLLEAMRCGCLYSSSDIDYYAVTLQEKSDLRIVFNHVETGSSSMHWQVSLLDESGNVICKENSNGDQTSITLRAGTRLDAGSYYVKISSVFHNATAYILNVLAEQPEYLKGDVDLNGEITMFDAYEALMASSRVSLGLSHGLSDKAFLAADVNENDKIEMMDAYHILIYSSYLALGQTPDWDDLMKQ